MLGRRPIFQVVGFPEQISALAGMASSPSPRDRQSPASGGSVLPEVPAGGLQAHLEDSGFRMGYL